ncbi:hypothetical protein [Paraburkholderia sp. GAS334]|uniref:hypothetical protein n=1 Tax=Paraburkholderia sp. GAS334 TaxID=3035131 RepID=UPI003D1F0A21
MSKAKGRSYIRQKFGKFRIRRKKFSSRGSIKFVSDFFSHPFVRLISAFIFGTVIVGIFSALRDERAQEVSEHETEVQRSLDSIDKITDSFYLYIARADTSYSSLRDVSHSSVEQLRAQRIALEDAYASFAAAGSHEGAQIESIFPYRDKVFLNNQWLKEKKYTFSRQGITDFVGTKVEEAIIWWGWKKSADDTILDKGKRAANKDSNATARTKTLLTLIEFSHKCLDSMYGQKNIHALDAQDTECGQLSGAIGAGEQENLRSDHDKDAPTVRFDTQLNRIGNCGELLFDFMRRTIYRDDIGIFGRSDNVDALFAQKHVSEPCDIHDIQQP